MKDKLKKIKTKEVSGITEEHLRLIFNVMTECTLLMHDIYLAKKVDRAKIKRGQKKLLNVIKNAEKRENQVYDTATEYAYVFLSYLLDLPKKDFKEDLKQLSDHVEITKSYFYGYQDSMQDYGIMKWQR